MVAVGEAEEVVAFRARARDWIRANLNLKQPRMSEPGITESRALQARLFDAGFSGFVFPKEYGGAGLTFEHQKAFFDEAADYVTPTAFGVSIGMLAPTILDCASEVVKRRHLPRMLRGDEDFIQLLSEPSGGSDLAGALTRAERDGDTYVVNGSKTWSSGALTATHGLLLARTDWAVPKHRGLSMFVVPLRDQPGVTIEPIREVNGERHFCQEFFDDVVLAADHLVGEENEGWSVAQRLLLHERNATVGIGLGYGYYSSGGLARSPRERAHDLVVAARRRGALGDGVIRQLIGRAYADELAHHLTIERVMAGQRSGKIVGPWGSLLKLGEGVGSPARAELALAISGSNGVIATEDVPGGAEGRTWLSSRGISIAGGSNEMQRNIVSERLLGLPREHDPSREVPFSEIQRRRANERTAG